MTPTITADQRESLTTPKKHYQAEISTQDNGEIISHTVMASTFGPMVVCMSEIGTEAKPWAKVVLVGLVVPPTKAISKTVTWTAKVLFTKTFPNSFHLYDHKVLIFIFFCQVLISIRLETYTEDHGS